MRDTETGMCSPSPLHLQISYKSSALINLFKGDANLLSPEEVSNMLSGTKLKSPKISRCPCWIALTLCS